MSKLNITKVELHKSGKKVVLTYQQLVVPEKGETFTKDVVATIHRKPSEALNNSFVKFTPHAMFISEIFPTLVENVDSYINNFMFTDEPRFEKINVTAVEISGKDLDFVQFTVSKTTSKLETFTFKTPKIWLGDQEENAYANSELLNTNVKEAFKEAESFYKPSTQAKLILE